MLYVILIIAAIAVSAYLRWDTLSPKLVVKESAHWTGVIAKALPSLAKATVETAKTANAKADVEIARSGLHAEIGFKEGRKYAEENICRDIDAFTEDQRRQQQAAKAIIARIERDKAKGN